MNYLQYARKLFTMCTTITAVQIKTNSLKGVLVKLYKERP